MAYLQASQEGFQSYTRSRDGRLYWDSPYQPTLSLLLPFLVRIIWFIGSFGVQNFVRCTNWSESGAKTLLEYNLKVDLNETPEFIWY